MLRNATWTLSNFCRGKPSPPFELVQDALGILSVLIFHQVGHALASLDWLALRYEGMPALAWSPAHCRCVCMCVCVCVCS